MRPSRHHDARARLVTCAKGKPEEARALLHEHRLERVLVIMATMNCATRNGQGHYKSNGASARVQGSLGKLKVGGAISTGPDSDERAERMVQAGSMY